ncbi:site-2 protease family protein [Falsiroseomonas sp.]|uniref:site-2 protease family protein n=1 Tax=Falsiroseomonas sp. TaxID=2870721 RepID=UPI00272336E5|nr:site-2 protease family protein [Falsiroseomonas sp.]MDO9500408.1 site-2 protease family protein [Falsiroseomonas sp.]
MSWSIPLGRIAGTEIRLHLTFLLLLAWIGVAHGLQGGMAAAVQGIVFICLLFGCVVLHEFGHVAAARRYGVRTPDITLLPIGGVARLERMPEKPSEELVVALAGPAVNVVIALLLFLVLGGVPAVAAMASLENPAHGLLARLFWVNMTLAVFNLLPAFPMDGGRVLRALLSMRLGSRRATDLAAGIGQALAFALGLIGLLNGAPLVVFVALFVWLGAQAEAQSVQMRELSRGMRAEDAMITRFESLPVSARIADAAELLIRTAQTDFPVVDGGGRLRGILTRSDLVRALQQAGPDAPVLEAMQREVPVVAHRAPLEDALRVMQEAAGPIGVVDAAGRLIGVLTHENLGEMLMLETARAGARATPARSW